MAKPDVLFDVLLRPRGGQIVGTAGGRRHPGEAIVRCKNWLEGKGVVCHPTAFGLACTAPRRVFERLFRARLVPSPEQPGTAAYRLEKPVRIPEDISDIVEQVTLTVPPEYF